MKLRLYDENQKTCVHEFGQGAEIPGHSNRIFSIKFDPSNNNLMYSGGWDNTIVAYDIRQENPIWNMLGPHVCGESIDVHGSTLLTGSYDINNNLSIWDLKM